MAKNAEVEASYSGRIRATKIFRTIICVILCIISVFPFYLMIVNSTLDSNTIKTGVHLLPGSFAQFGKNFSGLMAKAQGVGTSLWGAMLHSAIISVPATILTVYCSTLTAYGLTVYNFKLKNAAYTFIMAIMMIPAQVSIIGFMQFMMKVHLYDSYWPLILPAAASPATYYFMKQYMATGLSLEIIEAGYGYTGDLRFHYIMEQLVYTFYDVDRYSKEDIAYVHHGSSFRAVQTGLWCYLPWPVLDSIAYLHCILRIIKVHHCWCSSWRCKGVISRILKGSRKRSFFYA